MHNHGGAVIKRTAQHWGGGIVDDQRYTLLAADLGNFSGWEDFELRVGEGLCVITASSGIGRTAEILRIRRIDKSDLHPHRFHHRIEKEVPSSPIKICGAYEIVA